MTKKCRSPTHSKNSQNSEPGSQKGGSHLGKRVRPYEAHLKNTTAKTLRLLSSDLTIKEIAIHRNTSIRNIYKLFTSYCKKGLITQERILTSKGIKILENHPSKSDVVSKVVHMNQVHKANLNRLHDLCFTIRILNKPTSWDNDRQKIFKLRKFKENYHGKEWTTNNTLFQEFWVNDIKVRTTPNSVLVFPSDIYAANAREAKNQAVDILYSIIPKLENLLSVKLYKPTSVNIKIGREHNAVIYNELAKWFIEHEIPLKIRDKNGELRVIIDDSEGLKELEFIHKRYAEEDAQRFKDYISDINFNNPRLPSEQDKIIDKTTRKLDKITKTLDKVLQQNEKLSQLLLDSVLSQEQLIKKLELTQKEPFGTT